MFIGQSFPTLATFSKSERGFKKIKEIIAVHSGNLGDIIYSLPTCYLLSVTHLVLNVFENIGPGGRLLTEKSARALAPLLLAQQNIEHVTIVRANVPLEYLRPEDISVHYILDAFRLEEAEPFLHLAYRHAVPYNLSVDPSKKWLTLPDEFAEPDTPPVPYLVVCLTRRYRTEKIEYYSELLREIPSERVYFVGVDSDQIERMNLSGQAVVFDDFIPLARLVKGCSAFIGNPSFVYALADGLKVNRWLEVSDKNNVYPLDKNGRVLGQYSLETVRRSLFEALGLEYNLLELAARRQRQHENAIAACRSLKERNVRLRKLNALLYHKIAQIWSEPATRPPLSYLGYLDGVQINNGPLYAYGNISNQLILLNASGILGFIGWFWCRELPQIHFEVDLICDGEVLCSSIANRYRQDLFDANIGDGHYAFLLEVSIDTLRRQAKHRDNLHLEVQIVPAIMQWPLRVLFGDHADK